MTTTVNPERDPSEHSASSQEAHSEREHGVPDSAVHSANDLTAVCLEDILSSACNELFATYGINVAAKSDSERGENNVIGRVHFIGERMTGNLTIGLDRDQLRDSLPFRTSTESELEDWARELANQLMGLVKTALAKHGVHVLLSLPLTITQEQQSCDPRWPPSISQFNVACNFASALSLLDGVMTAEVKLQTR